MHHRLFQKPLGQRGMSLISVMIASSIGITLIMLIFKSMQTSQISQQSIFTKREILEQIDLVELFLKSDTLCAGALAGVSINSTSPSIVNPNTSAVLISEGKVFKGWTVSDTAFVDTQSAGVANFSITKLQITADMGADEPAALRYKNFLIPLIVETDSSSNIIGCGLTQAGLPSSYFTEVSPTPGSPGATSSVALCPTGFKRVGCTGSRHPNADDNCNEADCGLVGVIPVTVSGQEGCKVGIDSNGANRPTVSVFCIRSQ